MRDEDPPRQIGISCSQIEQVQLILKLGVLFLPIKKHTLIFHKTNFVTLKAKSKERKKAVCEGIVSLTS